MFEKFPTTETDASMQKCGFGIPLLDSLGVARTGSAQRLVGMATTAADHPGASESLIQVLLGRPIGRRSQDLEMYLHQIQRNGSDFVDDVVAAAESRAVLFASSPPVRSDFPDTTTGTREFFDEVAEVELREAQVSLLGPVVEQTDGRRLFDAQRDVVMRDLFNRRTPDRDANPDSLVDGFFRDTRRPSRFSDPERQVSNALRKVRDGQTQRVDIVIVDDGFENSTTLDDLVNGFADLERTLQQEGTTVADEFFFIDDTGILRPIEEVRAWDLRGDVPQTVVLFSRGG